jgi:hypothetical protein
MNCLAYPLKHVSHTSVIIPFGMSVEDLPKSVRHEIDMDQSTTPIELQPGHRYSWLNDDEALMDIKSDGYHIQGTEIMPER